MNKKAKQLVPIKISSNERRLIVEKLEALEIALLRRDDDAMKYPPQELRLNQLKTYQSEIRKCASDLKNLIRN
jgi:hypothetical protein